MSGPTTGAGQPGEGPLRRLRAGCDQPADMPVSEPASNEGDAGS